MNLAAKSAPNLLSQTPGPKTPSTACDFVAKNLGGTILIVDDTVSNLQVLSDALFESGFEVAVATSGESALRQISYAVPSLILLDVQMGGMDGFETCRRLKANPSTQDIPVIFMTALSEVDIKLRGFEVGAVDYITKPFQQAEVLARVQLHLKLAMMTQQLTTQNVLLMELTDSLEQRVKERTEALNQANLQLMQQEKMSSLGQLVAGVAHEINNPINYIHGNMEPAATYVQDILLLLELYQQEHDNPSERITELAAQIDLPFVQQDLPKVLESIRIGTERIRGIVLSLRNFSRLDEAEIKDVDLHEGIDNTMMIINHRLKANVNRPEIIVDRAYGDVPPVCCYAGQLNQVFMNLLVNAIDALDETCQPGNFEANRGKLIKITTEVHDRDWVRISFQDNGPGIPEKVQQYMFNPFFTTKEIGKGTGLGLAISLQIVQERHHGRLYCQSSPAGTTFTIEIPIVQTDALS
jgi:two-component system, NtrC family, sensor kinase